MEYFMSKWDLMDIKPTKVRYTWTNRWLGINHIATRLDHFLVSIEHLTQDKRFSSSIMDLSELYHRPISLVIKDSKKMP